MARRYFRYTNYRNLGLEGNTDNKIIINNSLDKGKLGNLVILIGPNNSGKSNVLDGILSYKSKNIDSSRDVTTLSFNDADRNPSISLVYENEEGHVEKNVSLNGVLEKFSFEYKNESETNTITKEIALNSLHRILEDARLYGGWTTDDIVDLINNIELDDCFTEAQSKKFLDYSMKVRNYNNRLFNKILQTDLYRILNNEKCVISKADTYIEEKYGYNFESNIIKYVEKQITSQNLKCNVDDLRDNLFFKSLFKAIGIDPTEIINGYKQYRQYNNSASLNKMRRIVNEKTIKLNEQFNKLYFAESDEYKFTIDIESNSLSFGMARGKDEDPIMIEMQSTGFRWFFNLYFNFICSNELKPGDIIVMDEPATNLHPEGQRELRAFIKKFAQENDLTFIIATHSPFLIDTDNYDELRLVSMYNNRSSINNLFSAVNVDDPDSLLPIKEALTIKQNVLYDLDTEVIWVEGITDYNYLTMFKNFLGIKNVSFIPYNGNGKDDEEMKEVLSKLISIKFFKCGILIDSDTSGNIMKKLCTNTKFKDHIYQVGDVDKKFIEIEDLFSEEDKTKYESLNKNSSLYKKAFYASMMKNTTTIDDYSKETIDNFKKLFNIIND